MKRCLTCGPSPLQQLATQMATDLASRVGVDAALVVVLRKSDDASGLGYCGPGIPFDTAIGATVELIGRVRAVVLAKASRAAATPDEHAQPGRVLSLRQRPSPPSDPSKEDHDE